MIAVVTGGSGFIGAHLVEALVADGIAVRLLRRPGVEYVAAPRGATSHVVELSAADAGDSAIWRGATHVFHLAARTRALRIADFARDNLRPTEQLAALLARRPEPPRLVFVSSQAAAGPAPAADRACTEDYAARPVEPYGESKRDAEAAVRTRAGALPSVIVRPSSVYGPRDRDFLQVFRQLHRVIALQVVPSWHRLSLVHVRDLVSALRLAASRDEAVGRTFFIEDGKPVSWGTVYDDIGAVLGRSPVRMTVPEVLLRGAAVASEVVARARGSEPLLTRAKLELARQPYWLCDATAARHVLGWRATIAQRDGWAETGAWYREARWLPS
jgi:nucleoside-diphosphate-sugar epimerase